MTNESFRPSIISYNDGNNQILTTAKLGTTSLNQIPQFVRSNTLNLSSCKNPYLLIRHPFERYVSGLITSRTFTLSRILLGELTNHPDLHEQMLNISELNTPEYWTRYIQRTVMHTFKNDWSLRDAHTANWLSFFDDNLEFKVVHLGQLDNLLNHLG